MNKNSEKELSIADPYFLNRGTAKRE